jgi:hypothetical protein
LLTLGLIAVRITNVGFHDTGIGFYDTYFVIPTIIAVLILLRIPELTRRMNRIVSIITDKSKSFVKTVFLINGLFVLGLVLLIYLSISSLLQAKEWYPGLDISNYLALVVGISTVLYVVTVLEVRIIQKMNAGKV